MTALPPSSDWSLTLLDWLCWPLALLLLARSLRLAWRGSFVTRNGRCISRQSQPAQFWAKVVVGYAMAIAFAVAGWTHFYLGSTLR